MRKLIKLTRIHLIIILVALGAAFVLTKEQFKNKTANTSNYAESNLPLAADKGDREQTDDDPQTRKPGDFHEITLSSHTYQTFNNCGPATLSMILDFYDIAKSQKELGLLMRPHQNPQGNNDDKSLFSDEFVRWAKHFGLPGLVRPAGDLELIKTLVANDLPVVVRTWLNPGEDIGHYRIIHGFDDSEKILIQTDSYFGPNRQLGYSEFMEMWQPFNYEFFVIHEDSQKDLVAAILEKNFDEAAAWINAEERAKNEILANPSNIYAAFNLTVTLYHQSRFLEAVQEFEKIEGRLPSRMLWYQIEPILAYAALGESEKVFAMTDKILDNGNRAFSELYQIRGEIYANAGAYDQAKREFELAILYNENFEKAKQSLKQIENYL